MSSHAFIQTFALHRFLKIKDNVHDLGTTDAAGSADLLNSPLLQSKATGGDFSPTVHVFALFKSEGRCKTLGSSGAANIVSPQKNTFVRERGSVSRFGFGDFPCKRHGMR